MSPTPRSRSHSRGIKRLGRKTLALVLGGSVDRERRCVGQAAQPKRPVWLSGPALTENCLAVCAAAGCSKDWLLVDYQALDTLSNFTSLVDAMKEHNFGEVIIVTSRNHIDRALAIAEVVLVRYAGIRIGKPIIVEPSDNEPKETEWHLLRDRVRAWLWYLFKFDVTLPFLWVVHPQRLEQRDRRIRDYTWRGMFCYGK
mmetsp:Transcript_23970/g.44476  ORF Transcript_23970/g.44476 Transcript_23970/m.44476 type:complete len:199 (+) Transcript_23970:572-1168(+)|eukprot:CAMPEP_0184545930 /NCGR_PEP_ID=MMETSP0199_2-20130426/4632_1 /TAXON_ID=1112570 /ORGANISM="Thraustochytrium sp., Strain LLF1b" /LENGTH=198 /DNA_ID=CAMNT_0026940279 /DNA_START=114 /DNA_END=710 /DNA_ORIENTATION=+